MNTKKEVSQQIQEKCFELCLQYIWKNITKSELSFEPIVSGTNQLIKCTRIHTNDGKPQQIAVKLYTIEGRPLDANDSVFNDLIIGLIISENGLGPKIYGISGDAVLMEYLDCHQFVSTDQKNPLIMAELGRKLARVHSLRPPIKRSAHWITVTFTESNVNSYKKCPNSQFIKENQLNYLIENDFESEFKLLMKVLDKCESPIVFSHNDFGSNNILVTNEPKLTNGLEERIVLSDFEFSSYEFRGRDFGLLFDDWLQFNDMSYNRNSHSIIEPFLESYLSEGIKIMGQNYANNLINSLKHLIIESKVFLLLARFFYVLFYLNADQTIFKHLSKVEILKEANQYFGKYLTLKQLLIEENLFQY